MIDEAKLLEVLRDRFEYQDGEFIWKRKVGV